MRHYLTNRRRIRKRRYKRKDVVAFGNNHQYMIQQAGFVPACLLCIMLCAPSIHARVDTTQAIPKDTNHRPLPALGRLAILHSQVGTDITKQRVRLTEYQGLSELLVKSTAAFPRSMGGFGQHNSLTYYGEDPAAHAVSVNGRPLIDPWSQRFHYEQWSVEGLERIEILHGTDAIGLGGGMALHAVNMQQIIYNTRTPVTRLWYAQGGGEFIAGDVSLAQNVARNLNASIGIRRSGAIGRFDQTSFDVWNVRAALRWTPSARLHTALTYDLSSFNTDLWGGVRGSDYSTLTEPTATPVFAALRDLSRRHDLQLSAAFFVDEDSTTVIHGGVYGTRAALLRIRDTTTAFLSDRGGDDVNIASMQTGIHGRLEQRMGQVVLSTGGSADLVHLPVSVVADGVNDVRLQAWSHMRWQVRSDVNLRAATRLLLQQGELHIGAGITGEWVPSKTMRYAVDLSAAPRLAGPTERTTTATTPAFERHLLLRLMAEHTFTTGIVAVEGFYRRIGDPLTSAIDTASGVIATTNTNSYDLFGCLASSRLRWKQLELSGAARLTVQSNVTSAAAMPLLYGSVTAAYVYETTSNAVRFGCTVAALSPVTGPGYTPITWTFVGSDMRQAATSNGIDAHVTATVGNAVVRAAFENILGIPWFSVAGYPQISRNFRLSVHWSFFD